MGKLPNYRTHRHRLYGEQEGVCAGCDTHFPFRVMDVDHKLPQSRGGTDHPDNLQLLCSGCNRSKGGRTMAEWRAAPDALDFKRIHHLGPREIARVILVRYVGRAQGDTR